MRSNPKESKLQMSREIHLLVQDTNDTHFCEGENAIEDYVLATRITS